MRRNGEKAKNSKKSRCKIIFHHAARCLAKTCELILARI